MLAQFFISIPLENTRKQKGFLVFAECKELQHCSKMSENRSEMEQTLVRF